MSPKARFQILLEPDQLKALREREFVTGMPLSRQIRRAIDAWLKTPLLSPAAEQEVIKAFKEAGFPRRRKKAASRRARTRRKA